MSEKSPLSLQEQQAAYDRARNIIEKVAPTLKGRDPSDVITALTLLIAKSGLQLKLKPEEVVLIMKVNMSSFYEMWEKSVVDVETGYGGQINKA